MTLEQSKREIVKELSTAIVILKEVPFYTYPEERIFALNEAKRSMRSIKTEEDLKNYSKRLLEISKEFAGKKSEGLEAGYKMAHIIVRTELENMGLSGKKTSTPKRKSAGKK